MMRRTAIGLLLLSLLMTFVLPVVGVLAQGVDEDELVNVVSGTEPFPDWLAQHEGWTPNVYPGDEPWWTVEFNAEDGEWLGYATINADTGEIGDIFAPTPLPDDEFMAGQERVYRLVMDDPEVQVRLVDPILWSDYTDFNRWDRVWEVHFYRGIEAILVRVNLDENGEWFSIDEILDENALDEEQARQDAEDQAISVAYSADGLWDALDGYDDWDAFVTPFNGSIWAVEFVTGETDLFYALVDITTDTVLETKAMEE